MTHLDTTAPVRGALREALDKLDDMHEYGGGALRRALHTITALATALDAAERELAGLRAALLWYADSDHSSAAHYGHRAPEGEP